MRKSSIKKILWIALLALLATAPAPAGDGRPAAANPPETKPETVRDANDFTLFDADGNLVQLSSFKGKKIVVLEWVNYDCPFVKAHYSKQLPTSTALYLKYKDRDVVWLLVNSTHYATAESTKEWAAGLKLPLPILMDTDGRIGRLYDAKTTPHLFVVSKEGKLVYQGAFDNAPLGKTPADEPYLNYVDRALEELTDGKEVSIQKTKPYGCTVKYPPDKQSR